MLGVVVGSYLLIIMSNLFSGYAHLSAGLFGILLIAVMTVAPTGIVGSLVGLFDKVVAAARARAKALVKTGERGA